MRFARERVESRNLDFFVAVAVHVIRAKGIDSDEKDVGRAGLLRTLLGKGKCRKQDAKGQDAGFHWT